MPNELDLYIDSFKVPEAKLETERLPAPEFKIAPQPIAPAGDDLDAYIDSFKTTTPTKPKRSKRPKYTGVTAQEVDDLLSGEHGETVRKFFGAVKWAEGGEPDIIVGGKQRFDPTGDHPNVVGLRTAEGPSTAAGDFQITGSNWYGNRRKGIKGLKQRLGAKNFTPENQLRGAVMLFGDRDNRAGWEALKRGDIETAMQIAAKDWAAVPGSNLHKNRSGRNRQEFLKRLGQSSVSPDPLDTYINQFVPKTETVETSANPLKLGENSPLEYPTPENLEKLGLEYPIDQNSVNSGTKISDDAQPQNAELPDQLTKIGENALLPEAIQGSDTNPLTVADFDANQAFMFGDPNAQANRPDGANVAQLVQKPDSEYLKYLKYTGKTDSPQIQAEYRNLLQSDFGKNVEVAADVNSPNPDITQETFPQDAAILLQNESNTNRVVRSDADMLGAQAARVAVDLSKAPQGMDKNEFAIRASMKAIAADYGLTDADINRAVGIMKGTDGALLKQGDVNERNDVINVRVPFGNIVAALGGTAQNIPDIVRKKFGELQGDRQLRLATSEQPLEKDQFGNPVLARDVLNRENRELRKTDDDLLREEAIRNMMASPLVIHDEEGIQNEIQRIRKMRFDRSDKEEVESFAEGTKNFGNGGSFVSGLVGGAGRSVSTIAGIMRPFEELGVLPENWYTSVAKYGKKLQAGDEEYAKRNPDGSTILRVTGGALSDIPRLVVMSELPGGAVVGFAADSGLQSAGRGESVEQIAGQTAKGATIGAIFGAASKLGKMAESGALRAFVNPVFDAGKTATPAERLVSKVFGVGVKIGTIGSGTFTVERISGATNEEALNAAIGNALFDFVTAHGGGVVKGLAGLSGKIIRNWKNGKPIDVTVKSDGTVERIPQLADKSLVDIEMILDPMDGVYKQKADYAEYQNFGKENGTAQPVNNKATETSNIPNNFERLETSVPPRELAEQNPSRIDAPMPDAVQRASIDTRAQRIVENLKGKDAVSVEELAKLTKFNKKNVEDAVMLLYGARQVEILPDNRIRFIGGENSAVQPKSIFERAQEANKTGDLGLNQNPNRGGNPGGSNVVLPSAGTPLETRADNFNAQMQRSENLVKPSSKIEFAEPPDIAQKLNVFTERGTKAQAAPMVVDSSELLTSLDADYPMELQPRDRSRMASKAQISDIANKLNPEFLGDSPKASDGRPLVVPVRVNGVTKYAVVSGNGRSEAIRQAYDLGKGEGYRAFVQTKAGEDRKNLQKPVYVGVLNPNEIADLSEFAKEANESATAQMSATEQARSDAERLDGDILNLFQPSDDGTIHSAANRDFTRAFLERAVPVSEQNRLVDGNGVLNQDGVNRVKNAIFAAAFGDSEKGLSAIQRMSESTDNNVKNITAGLLASSGGIVKLKNDIAGGKRHAEFDISNDLATAMEKYAALRENSISMDEYISQGNLFGAETSPFQTRVMQVFDNYKRSPKAIRTIITNFLDAAEAAGDPNQQNLFGEKNQIDVKSAFEAAVENYEREYRSDDTEQSGLFDAGDQGLSLRSEAEGTFQRNAEETAGEQTTGYAVAESGSSSLNASETKPEEQKTYKFSSTQVNLPKDVANRVREFARVLISEKDLAEDGYEENPHITVKYGLHTKESDDVEEVLGDAEPVKAMLGKTRIFEGKDSDVVIIAVKSPGLRKLNKEIAENTKVTDTFPTYKPHVTLAYVKKGEGKKYTGLTNFEGVEIDFDTVQFSSKTGEKTDISLTDDPAIAPNNSDSLINSRESNANQFSSAVNMGDVLPSAKSETPVKRTGFAAIRYAQKTAKTLTKNTDDNSPAKFTKSEAYRKEETDLGNRLSDLMDNSVSELGEKAKANLNDKTQTLELNEEAATIVSFALRQSGEPGDPFFGVYLAPDKADLVRANIFNFGKAVYRKGNIAASARLKKLMQEFDKAQANEFKDVSIAVKSELAPQVFEQAREEESAHRADFRVRNFERKDIEVFKQLDSYKKAVENVKKDYQGASERQLHNEVIAKMFRTDAEDALGISPNEIKQIRKAYRKQLIKNSIPSEKFKKEFSNISKNADKAIQDYERLFRKTERNLGENVARGSEQPISSNESVREIRGEGRGYSPRSSDGKSRNFGIGFDDTNRNSTQSLVPANQEIQKFVENEIAYAKPKKGFTVGDVVLDLVSAPKSLKSSVDLSAAGRQGIILSLTEPKIAATAFVKQLQSLKPSQFEKFKRDLNIHPFIELAEESGLYLSTLSDQKNLVEREEQFMSRIFGDDELFSNKYLEKTRRFVTAPIRYSEHAYVTYLDKLRIETFAKFAKEINEYNVRKGKANDLAQYKGIATFINYATGRGDLGVFNNAAPILNATFFSARYWASRLQLLNPIFYAKLPPGARKIALRKLAGFFAAFGLILLLAKLAGADISFDDPNNPTMLKITFGKWSYDFGGGLIQHVRYISRMIAAVGEKDQYNQQKYLTERYVRSKLAPVPAAIVNSAQGKNYLGEPTDKMTEFKNLWTPLSTDNFAEAVKSEGTDGVFKMLPEFFGISSTRFKTKEEILDQVKKVKASVNDNSTTEEKFEARRKIKLYNNLLERTIKSEREALKKQ